MTKSQQYGAPSAAVAHWRAPAPGELVACAKLWLTRRGDPDDHVLHPGQRVWLARGDDVVIEALHQGPSPAWRWQAAAWPARGWRAWLARPAGPVVRPGSCTPG